MRILKLEKRCTGNLTVGSNPTSPFQTLVYKGLREVSGVVLTSDLTVTQRLTCAADISQSLGGKSGGKLFALCKRIAFLTYKPKARTIKDHIRQPIRDEHRATHPGTVPSKGAC